MIRLLNVITLTFLFLIAVTQSESIFRSKRNLNNPMASNKEGQSNLAPVPWFGPPIFGYPGFPFFSPPNPQQIFNQANANIKAIRDQIENQNAQMMASMNQNDCADDATDVYTEDYTVGGKNWTYTKKTCKVDGPNGSSSRTSSSVIPNSGSSSSSSSGPSSGASSSASSFPVPDQSSSSSSSSGQSPDSSASSSSNSVPSSDQGSNPGPAASSAASSGPGASSGATSGAYSAAGNGMSMASASGK